MNPSTLALSYELSCLELVTTLLDCTVLCFFKELSEKFSEGLSFKKRSLNDSAIKHLSLVRNTNFGNRQLQNGMRFSFKNLLAIWRETC